MSKSAVEFESRTINVHQRLITSHTPTPSSMESTYPYHAAAYPSLDEEDQKSNASASQHDEPSAISHNEGSVSVHITDPTASAIVSSQSAPTPGSSGSGGGGTGPFIFKGASCCRSCSFHMWIWPIVIPFVFLGGWIMLVIGGMDVIHQIASKEQTNVMVDQVQLWTTILHAPVEAGYELQSNLAQKFPHLLSTTPSNADVFNMTTLQTTTGWLSGFAEVATKHPQLRSFGMMALLNNDTTGPKNQIYIEYTKPVNSTSLYAAGQVMIQMNTADQQLLVFSPNKSLHPINTNTYGFNQLFSSDVMYSDSSDAIRSYLGQSFPIISNHSFDLTNTATFQAFQQFLQLNQTIGYLALQPPTNFNGGLRMIAATNLNQSSSTQFLTFGGYSTADLNQLLSTFPLYTGDAFLISPQGGIIASTNGIEGSNLWSFGDDDQVITDIRDFLWYQGLIIDQSTTTLSYQAGLRKVTIDGGKYRPTYTYLAQMIAGLPDNSQLSLVARLSADDLYDTNQQLVMIMVSLSLWMVTYFMLFFGLIVFWISFHRLVVTTSAIWYYYSQDGRRDGRENCIDLLKLVHGWKLNSRTNRPIPPRVAELITVFIPQPVRRPAKGELLLENPPRVCGFMHKLEDLAWINDLIEKWLYEFVEGECAKHMPKATRQPLPSEQEMKSA